MPDAQLSSVYTNERTINSSNIAHGGSRALEASTQKLSGGKFEPQGVSEETTRDAFHTGVTKLLLVNVQLSDFIVT